MTRPNLITLVPLAERVGMAPAEWLAVCSDAPISPPTPAEWREAMLSTLQEDDS